jgi:uncharacterized protein (TIGR02421 family)
VVTILSDRGSYTAALRELSDRLVEAQRPIRILDAIQWDESVRKAFFASQCQAAPPVNRDYYRSRALDFDPFAKRQQLHDLERDIVRRLGQYNPVSQIMRRMCREYLTVVRMLEARGTPEFVSLSQELYGSASDVFHAGDPTVADLGVMMSAALDNIDQSRFLPEEPRGISGEQAVALLQQRLDRVFPDKDPPVRVILSDGILADAAAGSDYIKLRQEAVFNERDLRILEVHEGWVHIGTNINGHRQPYCTFLSKAPPSATITQEGLALLTEVFSFCSHPDRLRRVTNRIRAVDMAEQGAHFLEVFEYFRSRGSSAEESYNVVSRVFRGSTPDGGPFTKDLAYSKGFVQIYNYIRLAVRKGMLERISLLFCGKAQLEDARVIAQLVEEGLVERPRYLPPPFADLNALAAWMCYSSFLSELNMKQIEADYSNLF